MASETTTLELAARSPEGSRAARRLRREGKVPGTLYGVGAQPASFQVDARILRNTLAHAHAVIEVSLDGGDKVPVMVKDVQRHPVRSDTLHVDLLRVDLTQKIQTTVPLTLTGTDVAPGVKEGGVLMQETIQLTVEALPNDVPDAIEHDVSGLEMANNVTVADIPAPAGLALLDDPELVVATIAPPTLEPVDEAPDLETQLVSEGQAEGDTLPEAEQSAEASTES